VGVTDPLLGAALDLAAASLAPSTVASYRAAWREFADFAAGRGAAALPADRALLGRWLAARAHAGRGGGAGRALAAVRAAHLELGFADPTADAWVQRVAAGAERAAAMARPARELRAPLPVAVLTSLLAAVPGWLGVHGGSAAARAAPDASLLALRDAAVVALGLRLMRRAGELAALCVSDVRRLPDGTTGVTIRRSKTDQLGAGLLLPLDATGGPACPVALLERWLVVRPVLATRGAHADALFVTVAGRPLSRSAISSLVARAAAAAGLDGRFSGHSLRIGGATAAARAGASMATVKAVGGWSSDAVRRYVRPFAGGLSALMGFG
jgi:integrase